MSEKMQFMEASTPHTTYQWWRTSWIQYMELAEHAPYVVIASSSHCWSYEHSTSGKICII